jgi:hypothetical protein
LAYARVIIPGDGVTTDFTVAFAIGIINEADVTARVGTEVDGLGAPVYRTITFISPGVLRISGSPAGVGVPVEFNRNTQKGALLVDYEDGDTMNDENLNKAQKQAIFIGQEAIDATTRSYATKDGRTGKTITIGPAGFVPVWDADGNLVPSLLPQEGYGPEGEKTTPVDADGILITDSAANGLTKRVAWSNIKLALNLPSTILGTVLAGLSLVTGTAVTAADTVLVAVGKLQKQITDLTATVVANGASITGLGTTKYDKTGGDVTGNVMPEADATRSLGSSTKRWLGYFGDLMLSGSAGTVRSFKLASAGVARFKIGLGSGAEGGSNTGSTFVIWRCDDAGNDIDTPYLIDRATGISTLRGSEVTHKSSAAATAQHITRLVAEATTGTAIMSLDPGNNGYNVRDFSIRASNNGSNQITAGFYIANSATPVKAFDVLPTAVTNFTQRPTWNGSGLATQAEAAAGGGGAGVSSFAGRTGAVAATAGDYTSTLVTHASGTVSSYLGLAFQRLSFVSPEEYGLVGDGTTDNTSAWNAMMASLPASGTVIVWPSKKYYFAGIAVADRAVHHIGCPNLSTDASGTKGTIWAFGASGSFLVNKQVGGKYDGIVFLKTAQGANLVQWQKSSTINEVGSSYITFEDCHFYGTCTDSTVYLTNVLLIMFNRCRFYNNYKSGACKIVWLDGSQYGSGNARDKDNVDNIEFNTCIATGYAKVSTGDYAVGIYGFVLDGKCDSTKFHMCKTLWCYYGMHLAKSGPTTQVPNFTRFTMGGFENNYKNAVRLEYGDITTFSDAYASLDNDADSGTLYGNTDVILQETTYTGCSEFSAVAIRGGKRDGYRLEGGRTTINGGQSANNAIRATGYSVEILSTVTKVIMNGVDCTTYSTGTTGQVSAIRNLRSATGVIFNGCDLSGYATAITVSGSGVSTGAGITGNLT